MEERDVYGRLLCHLILPDGRNFNLLLVELGKSPYFNKYGNDLICHQAFVDAQARARKAQKGIWDPKTNVPKTEGAPSARRPLRAAAAVVGSASARHRRLPRGGEEGCGARGGGGHAARARACARELREG
jgi:hypothetical protein